MQIEVKEDLIRRTFTVNASAAEAFEVFVNELSAWWPSEYTWSGDVLQSIAIEPKQDGKCYETGPHNFYLDWGRVTSFEPPRKIAFTWQISPDRIPEPNPDKCSNIIVQFNESDGTTGVVFEHRDFHKHGDAANQYKKAMNSDMGWDYILSKYQDLIKSKGES